MFSLTKGYHQYFRGISTVLQRILITPDFCNQCTGDIVSADEDAKHSSCEGILSVL